METYKTLRDEFAMAAMQGDWAAPLNSSAVADQQIGQDGNDTDEGLLNAARIYYRMADAMLKEREKVERG